MDKKGQCPISFLWQGKGLGVLLMKAALVLALGFMFLKLLALLLHLTINLAMGAFLISGLWVVGKVFSKLKYGAQKRTRTSTK